MSVIINGDTGIDKITDGSVVQADLASGITVDSLSTASGSAPSYSARAWVTFNGNPVNITASGNVSSITDNGTGDYTVNFTTAMTDDEIAVVAGAGQELTGSSRYIKQIYGYSSTSVSLEIENATPNPIDPSHVSLVVFR